MAKNTGWVPQQHGAWAMLAVPAVVGLWQAMRPGLDARDGAGRVVVVLAFIAGYFLFNATTLMIKAARRRRGGYVKPVAAYAALTGALGLVALALLGTGLATWLLAFAPLAAAALLLVWMRQERSVVSGGLTVAAASLLATMLVRPDFLAFVDHWNRGDHVVARWTTIVCFLYFFGTVWAVKTMIRQRGSLWWWLGSIAYHLVALAIAGLAMWIGRLGVAYPLFFAATTVRAAILPRIGPLARPPRTITPLQLGLVECGFSVALTLLLIGLPPMA